MEVGVIFDGAVILLEPAAARSNGAIEVVDGFEVLVDERLIDKGARGTRRAGVPGLRGG